MAETKDPLTDYDAPPLVETVLGVQFDRLPGFRNAHLGAFWKCLGAAEWSGVQDVPPLPPQFERFERNARWAKGVQLQLTQDPACRLQIKNQDGDRMIQLQNNRLHFNWIGESGGQYPRYEKVREGFETTLRSFVDFATQEDLGDVRPNQWEVTYVNHVPQGTLWDTPKDWSFFKPLAGISLVENVMQLESFGGEWHFILPNQKGRLHVQWHHGVKSQPEEPESELVRLTFTARGPVADTGDQFEAVSHGLNLGRSSIVSTFRQLMSDDANKHWGIRDVDD